MLNNYIIDDKNGTVYIESVFKGEKHTILVSLENFELVKKCNRRWTVYKDNNRLYARGYVKDPLGRSKQVSLHRYITNCAVGLVVDHCNGNGLDNRINNLRPVTPEANTQNAAMRKDNTTGYRGVSRLKNGKYRATISVKGKNNHLGSFETLEEAAIAYWEAQRTYHPYVERNALPFI
jgi:hypothetical protein